MDVLNWKQKDFSGREFILSALEEPFGKLNFKSWTSYDAVYTAGSNVISFTSSGWFEHQVIIRYNGEEIGTAFSSVFDKTQLRLLNGEVYSLKSDTMSFERRVTDVSGETLIDYKQPTFSYGKGTIEISDSLSDLTKEVLVSSSLYLKAVSEQQVAILIIIFTPIFINVIN